MHLKIAAYVYMFLHISVISTLKNIPITYRDIFCKSQKNPFSLISFDDIAHFQCINLPIALQHKVIYKKNYQPQLFELYNFSNNCYDQSIFIRALLDLDDTAADLSPKQNRTEWLSFQLFDCFFAILEINFFSCYLQSEKQVSA